MENRVGIKRKMNCGKYATIIEYPKASCITIQFEDGKIVKGVNYFNFTKGKVAHPDSKVSRVGQKKMMNCGFEATIIKYRNSNDIDLKFEDGSIKKHRTYSAFLKGSINHPKMKAFHVGESNIMTCGLKAKIIVYRAYDDIDIQFEDGVIVCHKAYSAFRHKYIAHPKYKGVRTNRIGEKRTMHCGMEATIIAYRKSTDIDVQFADGTIAKHKTYNRFCDGYIANPSLRKKKISA